MFSGIVDKIGEVTKIEASQTNVHFTIKCDFIEEVYIDQSIAHNGACLTVVALDVIKGTYTVTAIQETLNKTNLNYWKIGDLINLERSLKLGDRLDGHMVQGHVDTVGQCIKNIFLDGSWDIHFKHKKNKNMLTVPKGSICVNGVSLTVVESSDDHFSVNIIPYTFEHTNFNSLKIGDWANLEFDILGKYFAKYMRYK